MKFQKKSYIIITPVKNEIKFFKNTLDSVCKQSLLPKRWLIVDDESTDGTSELIKNYSDCYKYIDHHRLISFKPELNTVGGRSGALVNYARKFLQEQVDYIAKIDADICFEADFFERLFNEFDLNPKLGIASGCLVQDFKIEYIKNDNAIRGATMVYRKKCFDQIKFDYTSRGEDEMNAYTARYYGWDTKTFDIYFLHLKHEGVRNTQLFNHYETGVFKGRIPYNFLFFFLTLIKNIFNKPFIIGSFVQLFGYIKTRFFTVDKLFNKEVCRFIREEQSNKLKNFFHLINTGKKNNSIAEKVLINRMLQRMPWLRDNG